MAAMKESTLQNAEARLISLREWQGPLGMWQTVDWREIQFLLGQLSKSLDKNHESSFREALNILNKRLHPRERVLRGVIGSSPKNKVHPLPPVVLEVLNHVIDKLQMNHPHPVTKQPDSQRQHPRIIGEPPKR